MNNNKKIGIIDSGIGGLTVAKEFGHILPRESIIYLGDNKNVPYGNKTEEEIYHLTKRMIDFLIQKDVKLVAVACNTISSILDRCFLDYKIPIVSIINPVTDYVDKKHLKSVGVIATKFTIETGIYEKLLNKKNRELQVVSVSCPSLASMIDSGVHTSNQILETIDIRMKNILKETSVKDVILGCTHYPIVLDKFKQVSPDINFINPAYEQTIYVDNLMEELNIKSNQDTSTFEIFTTGRKSIYLNMIDKLSIKSADNIYEIKEF